MSLGDNNYGIDAFHLDSEKRNLYLYQFKWSENYLSLKDSMRQLVHRGMDYLFGGRISQPVPDQYLIKLKSYLVENKSMIDQVLIQFVFNGSPSEAAQSETLMSLMEELEGKKYLVDEFFGNRQVDLMIQFRSNSSDEIGGVTHQVKTHKYRIDFHRSINSETPAGEKLQVGFMKLVDLYNMYNEMGPRFFDRNVRSGLSAEKPTNKAIQKSFANIVMSEEQDPEAFIFNHNGVTLSAENFEIKQGAAFITEPRLLNGAQTVTSLARFIESHEDDEDFEDNFHRLERIKVIGKVVSSASQDFVSNVTICNNRQNPVEPWNLRANDLIQLQYQEKFRNDLGLYYERQEGAFATLSEDDLDTLGMESQKAIEIKRLAQALLATQGEIDKLSRLRYVFENDSAYKNTFRESYLKVNSQKVLLAYKTQFRTNMIVRDFIEKWPNKYHYLGRGRNLIWSLLIQALFNDENSAELIESYGSSLKIEQDFSETLRELGSKRVRFILSDLTSEARYQEMIDMSNFTFLRTKATFARCMQHAADRFGWKKCSF